MAGGSVLDLKVVAVSDAEAVRLRRLEESMKEDTSGDKKEKLVRLPCATELITQVPDAPAVLVSGFLEINERKGQSYTVGRDV
jgi:hypothetical protein